MYILLERKICMHTALASFGALQMVDSGSDIETVVLQQLLYEVYPTRQRVELVAPLASMINNISKRGAKFLP